MKCASFPIVLHEKKWHSLVSLEVEIVNHHVVSMASLWFEVS